MFIDFSCIRYLFGGLMESKRRWYPTYKLASLAAKKLNASTGKEYQLKRGKDKRLPANPYRVYVKEWKGWHHFLNGFEKEQYKNINDASIGARNLGLTTKESYQKGYFHDPRLPSHPNEKYYVEWRGWRRFLGGVEKNLYPTILLASESARKLGCKSKEDYYERRLVDKRLPSNPNEKYSSEWRGWKDFLGSVSFYENYQEASLAAQKLGAKNSTDYLSCRVADLRLPRSPNIKYKRDWGGWKEFLGKVTFYSSLDEASNATQMLGISTVKDYKKNYRKDPRLPSHPEYNYKKEWNSWHDFFGNPKVPFYATLKEASEAAQILGATTRRGYVKILKEDPSLVSCPQEKYRESWVSWPDFLGISKHDLYSCIEEASKAARRLGVCSYTQYQKARKKDGRLPQSPANKYAHDWQGWDIFLGVESSEKYKTLQEASSVVRALGVITHREYRQARNVDKRLPSSPSVKYSNEWKSWYDFVGKNVVDCYSTMEAASESVKRLGINTQREYYRLREMDSKLPARPREKYKDVWRGWNFFVGRPERNFYPTLKEASEAAIRLNIKNQKSYWKFRIDDARLPYSPDEVYALEWKSWGKFLGKNTVDYYSTLPEASKAVRRIGVKTKKEYIEARNVDPKLPPSPWYTYADDWCGWCSFVGKNSSEGYYTYQEASEVSQGLGVTSRQEYLEARKADSRLNINPAGYYSEWSGWEKFLLPNIYSSLKDVKYAIKVLNIKNSSDYRSLYKLYPPLPAHPDRKFKSEWMGWCDLCDTPQPYSYDEAVALILPEKLSSKREYIDFIIQSDDPRMPRTPDQVYQDQWINWYVYLGTREPYRVKNIRSPYTQWAKCIQEFLRGARGGGTKESHLCRFVRYYIQAHEMGESPQKFLTLEKKDVRPFKEWLSVNEGKGLAHKTLTSVNEFLDFIIHEYLTDEDEETGELVLVENAHNPFSNFSVASPLQSGLRPEESVRHALAYQYVESAKQWLIPKEAKDFSDLKHLQSFGADWFDIAPDKVDRSDPNCVIREYDGKCQIWFPVYWMHTYALMSVPARGRQIAYCDSGEADQLIPVITASGNIGWEANKSSLSGLTNNQSFIKSYENGEFGMYFTSNKTSSNGNGYSVAWMPEDLAYWMVLLRNWQSKYNPISRPMPWIECVRTSLNERQRMAKGANCFLFRDFGAEESGNFSGRLASRLSAALYYSQPNGLELASLSGSDKTALSHYSSRYTPHSMRVSLITAYVDEFGLPLSIIMKVAGHSSIVMTIYYCKVGSENMRRRFSEGEKRAMQNKSYAAQRMIEQGRIDEIKNELIATSSDALRLISNETPAGTYLFRDYGICPYGGDRCSDGGGFIQNSKVRAATPVGYLGSQNCIACRHFITGPAFIGGLLSLGNEISLASHLQCEQYHQLEQDLKDLNRQLNECDDAAYDAELRGENLNLEVRNNLELQKRKTLSEIEAAAKKLDS